MCGCGVCAGMCGCAPFCVGVHGRVPVCKGVCGMNFQNTYWRLES